jgi:hypothetical protein
LWKKYFCGRGAKYLLNMQKNFAFLFKKCSQTGLHNKSGWPNWCNLREQDVIIAHEIELNENKKMVI